MALCIATSHDMLARECAEPNSLQVVDEDDINADDIPDDMEAIAMGDKCLMYRSSILEVRYSAGLCVVSAARCAKHLAHRLMRLSTDRSSLVPALCPRRRCEWAVLNTQNVSAVPHVCHAAGRGGCCTKKLLYRSGHY